MGEKSQSQNVLEMMTEENKASAGRFDQSLKDFENRSMGITCKPDEPCETITVMLPVLRCIGDSDKRHMRNSEMIMKTLLGHTAENGKNGDQPMSTTRLNKGKKFKIGTLLGSIEAEGFGVRDLLRVLTLVGFFAFAIVVIKMHRDVRDMRAVAVENAAKGEDPDDRNQP